MNRVQPVFEITEKMEQILRENIPSNNRQHIVEEIDALLIQREKYMENISEPYTNEELELGKKLLPINQYIQQKMNLLFTELKIEMKQMKKQKNSNRKYTNPYENVQTVDGMFMDKRK
jgi:flagellar protein FliT